MAVATSCSWGRFYVKTKWRRDVCQQDSLSISVRRSHGRQKTLMKWNIRLFFGTKYQIEHCWRIPFVWRICTPFIQLFCKTDFRWYLRVTQNKLSKNWLTLCNFLIHGSVGLDVPLPISLYLLLCSLWNYGKYIDLIWFDFIIFILYIQLKSKKSIFL